MQTNNKAVFRFNLNDIQRMVFEAVRRLRAPLNEDRKTNGYWNYERCYNEAKKYKSRSEFAKNATGAYKIALKNGWLNDYTWLITPQKISKWNKEACYNEAKKYKSKTEFRRYSQRAFEAASKNGWLDDYTWLNNTFVTQRPIYIVYKYEDQDTNAVYVGLTNNLKHRHRQHYKGILKHGEIKYDIVYKYWHNTLGKDVPEPIILHKDISAKDAQEYEKKYVVQFKNEGKLVLNIAKTGSLGGLGKWTKDKCFDEAKKYKSRGEFAIKSSGAYNAARKNGWLGDYTWFAQSANISKWNRETCYEEAKKYKSRYEYQKNSNQSYQIARRNGWLDDYTWFSSAIKWTYDTCYNEAKKYKSKWDFGKNNGSAYEVARKNGWLDDYTWFEKIKSKWNRETCYEEAKKYKSRAEFQKGNSGAYKVAQKNGWLDDYTWFNEKHKPNGYWNYDSCFEEAKKYKSRSEFGRKNGSAYDVARKNGWLNDYTWFDEIKKPNGYWNQETCYNEAKKYSSKSEFKQHSNRAYHIARKNGWLGDYTWFQRPSRSNQAAFG